MATKYALAECTEMINPVIGLDPEVEKLFSSFWASQWSAHTLDGSRDALDFSQLNEGERHAIRMIFIFFLIGDGVVAKYCADLTLEQTEPYEFDAGVVKGLLVKQAEQEWNHAFAYGRLAKTYLQKGELERLQRMCDDEGGIGKIYPQIEALLSFAKNWRASDNLEERMLGMFFFELGFQALFCVIFEFTLERNIMPALKEANGWIAAEEFMHARLALLMLKRLCYADSKIRVKVQDEKARAILMDAYHYTLNMMDEVISQLSAEHPLRVGCKDFVQYLFNRGQMMLQEEVNVLMGELIFPKAVQCPTVYSRSTALDSKTVKFFETSSDTYQKNVDPIDWNSFAFDDESESED